MKKEVKYEIFATLQFLFILGITLLAVFVAWIVEITSNSEGHINIYEAWRNLSPFFAKIIIWFSIFSLIRLIIVGLIIWRRKQID